jgi:hypothetical protein
VLHLQAMLLQVHHLLQLRLRLQEVLLHLQAQGL